MDWELKLMEWADRRWTSSLLDRVLPWLTHLGSNIAVSLFIILSWFFMGELRILYRLVLLYGIQLTITYGLKFLVRRPRPPSSLRKNTTLEILDPSFPSAHTLCAFMMAALLANWFPPCRISFFMIAGFVG